MARKTNNLIAIDANPDQNPGISIDDNPAENLTLEQIVADELIDAIDWQAVKKAILANIGRKFVRWFVSGNTSMVATNEIEAQAMALMEGEDQAA